MATNRRDAAESGGIGDPFDRIARKAEFRARLLWGPLVAFARLLLLLRANWAHRFYWRIMHARLAAEVKASTRARERAMGSYVERLDKQMGEQAERIRRLSPVAARAAVPSAGSPRPSARRSAIHVTLGTYACSTTVGIIQLSCTCLFMLPILLRLPERVALPTVSIYVLFLLLAMAASFYCSIPFARAVARQEALSLSSTVSFGMGSLLGTALSVLLQGFAAAWCVFWLLPSALRADMLTAWSVLWQAPFSSENVRAAGLLLPPAWFLLSACLTVWVSSRMLLALNTPYILFLRRFSTENDAPVFHAILRSKHTGFPLVIMNPPLHSPDAAPGVRPRTRGGNWDLLSVAYAGLSFWRPLDSLPVFVEAANDCWEQAVRTLVKKAACIVIDVSDVSDSMEREILTLQEEQVAARTVWLTSSGGSTASIRELNAAHGLLLETSSRRGQYFTAVRTLLLSAAMVAYFLSFARWAASTGMRPVVQYAVATGLTSWAAAAVFFVSRVYAKPAVDRSTEKYLRELMGRIIPSSLAGRSSALSPAGLRLIAGMGGLGLSAALICVLGRHKPVTCEGEIAALVFGGLIVSMVLHNLLRDVARISPRMLPEAGENPRDQSLRTLLDALSEGADKWNALRTGAAGEIRLDRAPLEHMDLAGADLSRVILTKARMQGADLRGTDLSGADLSEADLRNTESVGAKLCGAIVRAANLGNAHLELADLSKADLGEAYMSGVRLCGAKLVDANLNAAVLDGAFVNDADLTGANLSEAVLSDADLRCSKLAGANFHKAKLLRTNVSGADLSGVDLTCVDAGKANLRRANLSKTDLSDAVVAGADLREANLREARLRGTQMSRADLRQANLAEADLRGANLAGANLRGAVFAKACLSGADLRGASLEGAVFDGAVLDGTLGYDT